MHTKHIFKRLIKNLIDDSKNSPRLIKSNESGILYELVDHLA
jgi:hypothetical protein